MFGYVIPNKAELSKEDSIRYKSFYCGLCRTLNKKYGKLGTLSLSYDMAFLVLLLSDLYNSEEKISYERCEVHPLSKKRLITTEFTEYAADMQIILSIFSTLDHVNDEDDKKATRLLEKYKPFIAPLKEKYKDKWERIEEKLKELSKLEKAQSDEVATLSTLCGETIGEAFAPYNDFWHDKLYNLGIAMGSFIYINDAYDDIEKDQKNNAFNPLYTISKDEDFREKVKDYLTWAATSCSTQLEELPLDDSLSILRNIVYSGIWSHFEVRKK